MVDSMTLRLSIIIPAHNEEQNIEKMVKTLLSFYHREINEIIVVDDNSDDKTGDIIDKLKKENKKIKIIHRKTPKGVGLAIRDGLKFVSSNSTHVLTLDADFIENVPDIKKFFKKIKYYDGLVGSRYLIPKSLVRYPLMKRVANRGFHILCQLILGIKQKDLTNNFKFYRKEIFDKIPLTSSNFSINAETGIYPLVCGYKIGEIPVKWIGRTSSMGMSKFKVIKVGPDYLRVLLNAFLIKYGIKSIQALLGVYKNLMHYSYVFNFFLFHLPVT